MNECAYPKVRPQRELWKVQPWCDKTFEKSKHCFLNTFLKGCNFQIA